VTRQDPTQYGLPAYPVTPPAGPCVCGSWPGGECLHCRVVCGRTPAGWHCTRDPGHGGPCAAWPVSRAAELAVQDAEAAAFWWARFGGWVIVAFLLAGAAAGLYALGRP